MIYCPAQWSLHDAKDGDAPTMAESKAVLVSEDAAGSQIWIDSNIIYRREGARMLTDWLINNEIPFFGLGGGPPADCTHILIRGKLYEVYK